MSDRVSQLRRPAYTGENRCWPCTLVNAVALAAAVGVLALASPPIAPVVFLAGVVAIWLRGYLLPYTPRFAPQLVDRLPWDPFHPGRAHEPGSLTDAHEGTNREAVDDAAVEAALLEAGVLVDGDERAIADEFRSRWDAEMATLRELDTKALANAALEVAPDAATAEAVRQGGREYVALSDGSGNVPAEFRLRRPTAIAETGAVRAQAALGVPPGLRVAAADALCTFLSTCPGCGGAVTERVAGGCCGPPARNADDNPQTAMVCEDCGVHLHVFD